MVKITPMLLLTGSLLVSAPPTGEPAQFTDLLLTISADDREHVRYLPVKLQLKLSNETDWSVTGNLRLTPGTFLSILIKNIDDGRQWELGPNVERGCGPGPLPRELTSGEHVVSFVNVSGGAFPVAGRYELRARLANWDRKNVLTSAPITLIIVEPAADERAAVESLKAGRLIRLLAIDAAPMDLTDDDFHKLKTFVGQHGGSLYAPYASARSALLLLDKAPGSPEMDDDLARAAALIRALEDDFVYAPEAMLRLSLAYHARSDTPRSEQLFREVRERWPKSLEALRAQGYLEKLAKSRD